MYDRGGMYIPRIRNQKSHMLKRHDFGVENCLNMCEKIHCTNSQKIINLTNHYEREK